MEVERCCKIGLLETADEICRWARNCYQQHEETFWWNRTVVNAVEMEQKAWKQWKSGEFKDKYLKVKRAVKAAVYFAKEKMLRLKRLLVSTTIVIRIEFSK